MTLSATSITDRKKLVEFRAARNSHVTAHSNNSFTETLRCWCQNASRFTCDGQIKRQLSNVFDQMVGLSVYAICVCDWVSVYSTRRHGLEASVMCLIVAAIIVDYEWMTANAAAHVFFRLFARWFTSEIYARYIGVVWEDWQAVIVRLSTVGS